MIGYDKRKRGTRRQRNFFVIVCEGTKTEPIYFRGFNERYSRVHIEPVHSGSTDPRSIVEYAIEQKKEYQVRPGDGNEIWCVFDVDENLDPTLRNSIEHAHANGVNVALSNPSFEIWYLLHFTYREAAISRREVNEKLDSQYISGYDKTGCYNEMLFPSMETAVTNADRLNRYHLGLDNELASRNSNPSTQVFELVRAISELKRRNS